MTITRLLLITLLSGLGGGVAAQTLQWVKSMGGQQVDYVYDVAQGNDGSLYLAGHFMGNTDLDPGPNNWLYYAVGTTDAVFAKYDPQGGIIWAKRLGGPLIVYAQSITVDDQDNVYVAGSFQGTVDFDPGSGTESRTAAGQYDAFLCKFDPNGALLWVHTYGASSYDWAYEVRLDGAGNVYVVGYFSGFVDFDPGPGTGYRTSNGNADIFVAKYTPDGTYRWAINMGGLHYEAAYAVGLDSLANLYICGYFGNGSDFDPGPGTYVLYTQNKDIFTAKYDSSGTFIWANGMGGGIGAGVNCEAADIAVLPTGEHAITGTFWGNVDMDPGPGQYSLVPGGTGDAYVARYDADGAFVLARRVGGGTEETVGYTVAMDSEYNVYFSGYFRGTIDCDPTSAYYPITALDARDTYLVSMDESGFLRWAFGVAGSGVEDTGKQLLLPDDNTLFLAGWYMGTNTFDPLGLGGQVTAVQDNDMFLAKYDPSLLSTSLPEQAGLRPQLFPNPAGEAAWLVLTDGSPASVDLFDARGRLVRSMQANGRVLIAREELQAGLYLLRVQQENAPAWQGRLVFD